MYPQQLQRKQLMENHNAWQKGIVDAEWLDSSFYHEVYGAIFTVSFFCLSKAINVKDDADFVYFTL